jgi:hypothetical protein
MSLGGFTSSDPILTVDQFANLVASGQVRYVLVNAGGSFGGQGGGNTSAIMTWVRANGTPVPASAIGGSQSQLYDVSGAQEAPA